MTATLSRVLPALLIGAVAFGSLTITVALTVSMWGAFNVSRIWLASTGMLPVQIMSFLHEAYCRGVLRQAGGSYQFRHTELKEALIRTAPQVEAERQQVEAARRPAADLPERLTVAEGSDP